VSAHRPVFDSGIKFILAQKVFPNESEDDFAAFSPVPHCPCGRFYGHLFADVLVSDNFTKIQFHA